MKNEHNKNLDRRDFLKVLGGAAAVTSATLLPGCKNKQESAYTATTDIPTDQMTYRINPSTQDRVSLLGYGCMRWPTVSNNSARDSSDDIDQETVNKLVDVEMCIRDSIRTNRHHHTGIPTDLFRFSTFCRTICRPPTSALFIIRRHVFYPNGVIAARFRLELFLDSPRCCDYRLRFFGIPPRSIPSGTNSLGGQEKSGPVYFSSRRKRRKRHRAIRCV